MKLIVRLTFFVLVFVSCSSPDDIVDSQTIIAGKPGTSSGDSICIDSLTHTPFSRIRKSNTAGLQYVFNVSEANQNKHYYIVFKGRVRTNYALSNAAIVLMAFDKDKQQLCWMTAPLRPFVVQQNNWNYFLDSIHIPNVMNDVRYTTLNAFAYLGNSNFENMDIDTFKVTLKRKEEL